MSLIAATGTITEIEALLNAGATGFWVVTHEEQRFLPDLLALANQSEYLTALWSGPTGVRPVGSTEEWVDKDRGLAGALEWVYSNGYKTRLTRRDQRLLLVLHDPHELLVAGTTRVLREILMARRAVVVVTTPKPTIPLELQEEMQKIQYALPKAEELVQSLREDKIPAGVATTAADAAVGLTTSVARILVRRAVQRYGAKSKDVSTAIWDYKTDRWKDTGLLIINQPKEDLTDLGGYANLKNYLIARKPLFETVARDRTCPTPRGILIVGPPGTGKSLLRRAIAKTLERRYIEWDLGMAMGPYVGQTEEQTRRMLETTDMHAPACVGIDEIAHQFSGHESSGYTDSGVGARQIGKILTYMEERESDIFFVATTNTPWKCPSHLFRAGRFDNIWGVGLPTEEVLEEILAIHIKKLAPASLESLDLRGLALEMRQEQYAGAEVEQTVVNACQTSYPSKRLTMGLMGEAMKHITPAAISMKEDFKKIKDWMAEKAIPVDGDLHR